MTIGRPGAWLRAAAVAGAVALAAVAPPRANAAAPVVGTVVEARGRMLLLSAGGRLELVQAGPGTMLLGLDEVAELLPGDEVRVSVSRTVAGVMLADSLEAGAPWRLADPGLVVSPAAAASGLVPDDRTAPTLLAIDVRPADRFDAGHLPGARRLGAGEELTRAFPDRQAPLLFYGDGSRDAAPLAALRAAQAKGYSAARVLGGGLAGWQAAQLPMEIEVAGLARALAARRPFVIVDVRPADRARMGTLPGAISMPVATMGWRDFSGESWTPPFLLVGEEPGDRDLALAVQRLREWRFRDPGAGYAPPWVLVGGFQAWAGAGRPVVTGGVLSTRIEPPVDRGRGELSRPEFMEAWSSQGKDGRLLLDVREAGTESPPFARHVPLDELLGQLSTLPRDREIIPFCDAGRRSRIAAELLRRNGFDARYFRGRLPN